MCTVSWRWSREGGYDLFFNRDELNTRAAEQPPSLALAGDVAYLAPRDGESGGTWLLVNARGVTVCLLNDYDNPWRPAAEGRAVSRGQVVRACAGAPMLDAVRNLVRDQPLAAIKPFHLLALAPAESPLRLHWDGTCLAAADGHELMPPLSSSSFAPAEVVPARRARYGAWVRNPARPALAELAAYHREHQRDQGAKSVLMRRPDAATRSICRVSVDARRVRLGYERVKWSDAGPTMGPPLSLELARSR